jgi:hypothetical protein
MSTAQKEVINDQHVRAFLDEPRKMLSDTAEEVDAYRLLLSDLVRERMGESLSSLPAGYDSGWKSESVPERVFVRDGEMGVVITQDQWAALVPLQRFALVKLVRSGHEGHNFRPALEEFGLL